MNNSYFILKPNFGWHIKRYIAPCAIKLSTAMSVDTHFKTQDPLFLYLDPFIKQPLDTVWFITINCPMEAAWSTIILAVKWCPMFKELNSYLHVTTWAGQHQAMIKNTNAQSDQQEEWLFNGIKYRIMQKLYFNFSQVEIWFSRVVEILIKHSGLYDK